MPNCGCSTRNLHIGLKGSLAKLLPSVVGRHHPNGAGDQTHDQVPRVHQCGGDAGKQDVAENAPPMPPKIASSSMPGTVQ